MQLKYVTVFTTVQVLLMKQTVDLLPFDEIVEKMNFNVPVLLLQHGIVQCHVLKENGSVMVIKIVLMDLMNPNHVHQKNVELINLNVITISAYLLSGDAVNDSKYSKCFINFLS